MIQLVGSVKRSFLFPSNLSTALRYYADMGHLFQYLPHITLIDTYSKTEFRVLFSSTELGIYQIQLYCDLKVELDEKNATIEVGVLDGKKPIKTKAGMHSIRGMAKYRSVSSFKPEGDQVRIYYHLHLAGELSKPLALTLVPDRVTDHIAESIAKRRIFEIADGFITGSLKSFNRRKKNYLP
jgi:hypothetical protein